MRAPRTLLESARAIRSCIARARHVVAMATPNPNPQSDLRKPTSAAEKRRSLDEFRKVGCLGDASISPLLTVSRLLSLVLARPSTSKRQQSSGFDENSPKSLHSWPFLLHHSCVFLSLFFLSAGTIVTELDTKKLNPENRRCTQKPTTSPARLHFTSPESTE